MDTRKEKAQLKRRNDRQKSKRMSILTQDEVVLRQLCISNLFVQSAAGVQIHVSYEATVVKFLPDLPH